MAPDCTARQGQKPLARWQWALLLALILLAFGLRVHRLDQRSLWTDEGLSIYRARQSLADILSGEIVIQGVASQDTQPPLYFLLLHLQRELVGESGFGLKFLSAVWGVLAVPLFYVLGRRLDSNGTGLVAALLATISPFYLWYAQELRMYPMLIALAALSIYTLLRASAPNGSTNQRWWLAYLLATAAALYTHYTAFFLLGFEVMILLVVALRQRQRGALMAIGLAALGGLPLVPYAIWRLRFVREAHYNFVPLAEIVTSLYQAFSGGFIAHLPHASLAQLSLSIPLAIGLLAPAAGPKSRRWRRPALLLGWLALPTLALFGVSLFKPIFQGPRHLILVSPAFYLALAAGVAALWQRWKPLGALALLVVTTATLSALLPFYQSETFPKDDWRGLAAYVERCARPGDLVLLNDAVLLNVLDYYLPDDLALTALPPFGQPADGNTIAALADMARQYRRIWFVPQLPADGRDADRLVARWLEAHLTPTDEKAFHGLDTLVLVRRYDTQTPQVDALPAGATTIDVTWNGVLRLQGLQAPAEALSGDLWPLTFYWTRTGPQASDYILSLRFTASDGRAWAQSDEALWPLYPPAAWSEGIIIRHEHQVALPAGLPPGDYQAWLRIVDLKDDRPLPASTGGVDVLLIPQLTVMPNPQNQELAQLPPHTPQPARFGSQIDLVGYGLRQGQHRPGHLLYLNLYWRVEQTPAADYRLRLQLLDATHQIVAETVTAPTRADYPAGRWQPGELLTGQAGLLVPPRAEGGLYRLAASLLHPETGKPLPVRQGWWPLSHESLELEQVWVVEWPLITTQPPIQTPLRADFGAPLLAELHGYDLSASEVAPGEVLTLTLYWRASAITDTSYTVFVHLADTDEALAGQGDGVPDRGFRLTSSWRQGEVIVDTHLIPTRIDAPPGEYVLWVGFYHPDTHQRLPAFVDGQRRPADRVLLGSVQVKP